MPSEDVTCEDCGWIGNDEDLPERMTESGWKITCPKCGSMELSVLDEEFDRIRGSASTARET